MSHTLDKGRAASRGRRARSRLRTAAAVAAAVGTALAAPLPARAQPLVPQESGRGSIVGGEPRTVVAQRGPVSLSQAQTLALARFPGTVAGAKTIEVSGRSVHEIRIVGADNLVRTFRIDAQTGAFL